MSVTIVLYADDYIFLPADLQSCQTCHIWLHHVLIFPPDSELGRKWGHGDAASAEHKKPSPANPAPRRSKVKHRSPKAADKLKVAREVYLASYLLLYRMK